jgi:hypothetical protein
VRQNERRLVLAVQIAGERQGRLTLDLIHEDGDSRKVGPERHLVEGEQRAGRDREILAACLAAPARGTIGLPAVVNDLTPAVRADRLAVSLAPTDAAESRFGFLVRHAQDRAQGERPGLGREEEVR